MDCFISRKSSFAPRYSLILSALMALVVLTDMMQVD